MITVRTAVPDDGAVLAEIMVRSFRTAFSGLISAETLERCADLSNCTAMLTQVCKPPAMHSYLALMDGTPCGELFWQDGETAELIALHSLPDVWGSGVGAALLKQALADMAASGTKRMCLWAFRENRRARRFYEKHGLTATGEERISQFDGAVEVCYEKELHR